MERRKSVEALTKQVLSHFSNINQLHVLEWTNDNAPPAADLSTTLDT